MKIASIFISYLNSISFGKFTCELTGLIMNYELVGELVGSVTN